MLGVGPRRGRGRPARATRAPRRERFGARRAAQGAAHPRRRAPTAGSGSPRSGRPGWPPPAPATCSPGCAGRCSPPGSTRSTPARSGSWLHGAAAALAGATAARCGAAAVAAALPDACSRRLLAPDHRPRRDGRGRTAHERPRPVTPAARRDRRRPRRDPAQRRARSRELVAPAPMMAVVKADGYGHGMVESPAPPAQAGADWLGVAVIDEALALRAAGDTGRVLCWLAVPGEDYAAGDRGRTSTSPPTPSPSSTRSPAPPATSAVRARVQLKVDTGLSRGGVHRGGLAGRWSRPRRRRARPARSRSPASGRTSPAATSRTTPPTTRRSARSARPRASPSARASTPRCGTSPTPPAALLRPSARFDLVRCGIAAYGLVPGARRRHLRRARPGPGDDRRGPARAGQGVPAGCRRLLRPHLRRAARDTTRRAWSRSGTATASRGTPSSPAEVLVGGRRRPVRGRVCMDQFVVDLGRVDAAAPATRWCCSGPATDGRAHRAGLGRGLRHHQLRDRHPHRRPDAARYVDSDTESRRCEPTERPARAGAGWPPAAVAVGRRGRRVGRRRAKHRRPPQGRRRADDARRAALRPVTSSTEDGVRAARRGRRGRPVRSAAGAPARADERARVVFVHGYALNLDCWHFQRAALPRPARGRSSTTSARTAAPAGPTATTPRSTSSART